MDREHWKNGRQKTLKERKEKDREDLIYNLQKTETKKRRRGIFPNLYLQDKTQDLKETLN